MCNFATTSFCILSWTLAIVLNDQLMVVIALQLINRAGAQEADNDKICDKINVIKLMHSNLHNRTHCSICSNSNNTTCDSDY